MRNFKAPENWNEYFVKVGLKITDVFLSVKTMGLVASISVGTWLVVNDYISGDNFVSFVVPIFVCIYGIREAYKVGTLWQSVKQNGIKNTIEQTISGITTTTQTTETQSDQENK